MQHLVSDYEMFPLKTYLNTFPLDKKKLLAKNRPNFLISQLKSIPRDIVEQLERVGIYDTDDFLKAGQTLTTHVNISTSQYANLLEYVIETQKSEFKLPKKILQFPVNYALVSAVADAQQIHLGVYWRGLKLKFSDEFSNWNSIKSDLDLILGQMNHPDLIGRISLSSIPTWLDEITPLSTYLSNLDFSQDITDIAISWGLDPHIRQIFDRCDQDLLSQIYLIELQNRFSQ